MELEIRQVKAGDVALFDRVADAVFDEPVDPDRLAASTPCGSFFPGGRSLSVTTFCIGTFT